MKMWEANEWRKDHANMHTYMDYVRKKYEVIIDHYQDLHRWSVEHSDLFWSSLFDFFQVIYEGDLVPVTSEEHSFTQYGWFPKVQLNFAENLLRHFENKKEAIVGRHESGKRWSLSYSELYQQVASLSTYLRPYFKEGDVLAAYMPNIPETVVAMLATTGLGGTFTSTSCDFGVQGVVDRFGQSRPRVLVTVNAYEYNGKLIDQTEKIAQIMKEVDSIEQVIVVDFLDRGQSLSQGMTDWKEVTNNRGATLHYHRVSFNHPLYIMYSSGTTGKPKCIVHSTGGVLLQHLKELGLHSDLKEEKTITFFTTCGWMMWNWLVSSLYFGPTLVLYEGSPSYPSLDRYLDLIDEEQVNIFGTSPKFLKALEDVEFKKRSDYKTLETVLSTGSPLMPEQYDYVYQNLKSDVLLASISGGTDILGCFMLGNPLLPVYKGEIQCLGLGMDVSCFNHDAQEVIGLEGELVCRKPFVSQPTGFLNDQSKEKFKAAYFERFPGVWHHGDFVTLTERGGVLVYGRSDATLNPGGVRIGTAEIYRQTEKLPYIQDSLCVGKNVEGDVDVVLFVKMKPAEELNPERINEIKKIIRENTTARHVPKEVIAVQDIPYTRSGKKVELAVMKLINGKEVDNLEALANPECLSEFRAFKV